MSPFEYFKKYDKDHIDQVAKEAGTSFAYFEQLARGYRTSSIKLAKKLVKATNGAVPLEEWIPDLKSTAA